MFDQRLLLQLDQAFRRLSVSPVMMDEQGFHIVPDDGEEEKLPAGILNGGMISADGRLWLALNDTEPKAVICLPESVSGAKDILLMAQAAASAVLQNDSLVVNRWEAYRRILREEVMGTELEALAHEHQIVLEQEKCVILFRLLKVGKQSAYQLLNDVVPHSENDVLVELDRCSVALLKDMGGVEEIDEVEQFAQAVQETMITETAKQMAVGVGMPRANLAQIGESYREARRALEVGNIFQPDKSLYSFSKLMLERFMAELPRELCSHYHDLLFNRKTARLFNEEMLYTIEMFFKKDLNLSDTARQLYIHRNTLVYRLDKVQRQVGLDLRNFEDAVTFKMLLELKKCGMEKPQTIH